MFILILGPRWLSSCIEYTNVSVYNTTIFSIYIKIVYFQSEMFRPSLGHLQAFKENRSKICLWA